ncbi:GAK system CofD-like protein [Donghicola sp. C2-DW-16]|uniref:GAK system CofD-like protein n=1 Tax=Donghicola mangrovi TaxID=2729614 RepID=A0ABX2PD62_9RHOB|nr:GAK system CofD-like protein [Donghicola mangrovi]NVO27399.1 GAK system CofD-like protein [Donghicola mangrovi]
MQTITIQRRASVPDELRVARCLSAPHRGPRLLFFSGGSALNGISRQLKRYTHNSAHLITPFDSGGSSEVLRKAFGMPAVGDLRSRLMALAEETDLGQPDIVRLFSHRFGLEGCPDALECEVEQVLSGEHPLVRAVPQPMRMLVVSHLQTFAQNAPVDFDYAKGSVGNLVLAGGYLGNERLLEPVLFMMSKMMDVLGTVRSVVDVNLHIGAEYEDGSVVIGQKEITGKEVPAPKARIRRLFLADDTGEVPPEEVVLPLRNQRLIRKADLICYPPGSLYSSVAANLLPARVGQEIAETNVPKIYVPSLGQDPECHGMTLSDQVGALIKVLRADAGHEVPAKALMTHVICDVSVPVSDCAAVTLDYGIPCVRLPLAEGSGQLYDEKAFCEMLVSLV